MTSGGVRSSAGLVWRHSRLLWWIFALNLALAWLGSLSLRAMLRPVLDRSLESAKLVTGFDVSTLVLLIERPEAPVRSLTPNALMVALLFLLGMLAIDGGAIAVYLEDRGMELAEFGAYCARYFWRMARLAVYSLAPFGALMAAQGAVGGWAGRLARDAPQERLGFAVNVASALVLLLAALLVRLCFDLSQARMVQGDEHKVFRLLLRSWKPALRSGLYAQYLGIMGFAAASFGLGVWVWANLPHRMMGASFVVLELVTLTQIAARLWMKAASARWVALEPELRSVLVAEPVAAMPAVEAPSTE